MESLTVHSDSVSEFRPRGLGVKHGPMNNECHGDVYTGRTQVEVTITFTGVTVCQSLRLIKRLNFLRYIVYP